MIVRDASVAIDFLLDIAPYAPRMAAEAPAIAAPRLLGVEVTLVLTRFVLRREITQERARGAILLTKDAALASIPGTSVSVELVSS